jgi:hypothetical protein
VPSEGQTASIADWVILSTGNLVDKSKVATGSTDHEALTKFEKINGIDFLVINFWDDLDILLRSGLLFFGAVS